MLRRGFFFSEEQLELLELVAAYRDRPQAEIVRAALDLYLAKQALHDPHVQELMEQVREKRGKETEVEG